MNVWSGDAEKEMYEQGEADPQNHVHAGMVHPEVEIQQ